ncbi:outer membrane beta-barrel protein [Proteus terrae]|uniref:Outer membrane beta-barrel protein n=1 Tax=Proteus terrae subsp. cibarius TaxID=626774 RepID=A0A8I0WRR5_9GAMM|nr:outer membrane beta-barrel protein [Proteus terrae]MBG2913899.1 outer membrane beta-barrel protein [Proteus terrae subsp. cibarius]QHD93988.1 outer membrane beta-barrel protein [Proteus terrae subsp. cibarius]QJW52603.1 outer membrane beta-barrel protein [Proteus terrae subsp. cibarius]QKD67939.1 outer membrane beta-barrel protein [Proteus terrae subsp. cibarius]QKD73093.1 outer membrane beta-barrel protein [Proteus terrae subsp. cibarius]
MFLFSTSSLHVKNSDSNTLISAGCAYIKIKDLPTANGINIKYQINPNTYKKTSLQFSGTMAQKALSHNGRLRYASLTMGPAYSLTPFVELYSIIGVSGVSYQTSENINKDHSSKSVSWGAGITLTSPQNITLTLGYEGNYFKMEGKSYPSKTFISSIGYRF